MAEGIRELSVAFAPELIGEFVADLRACLERPRPEGVGVVRVDLQYRCRTADRQR